MKKLSLLIALLAILCSSCIVGRSYEKACQQDLKYLKRMHGNRDVYKQQAKRIKEVRAHNKVNHF